MMDRNKQQQGDVLEELQNELKSLKSLLLSRRPTTPSSPVPEPTSSNTVAPATKPVENDNTNGSSIPAWQMAAASSTNNKTTPAPSASTPQAEPATGSSSSSAAGSATNNTA